MCVPSSKQGKERKRAPLMRTLGLFLSVFFNISINSHSLSEVKYLFPYLKEGSSGENLGHRQSKVMWRKVLAQEPQNARVGRRWCLVRSKNRDPLKKCA